MPRIRNEAACRTCQQRKVRCDETLPVCRNCHRAKRYCDHTRELRYRHHTAKQRTHGGDLDGGLSSREALKDATTARLFAHYVKYLAAWYDLSDGTMHFTKQIPQEALSRALLFNAIIAFAAIHLSATSTPSMRSTAEKYHEHCIQFLLRLSAEDVCVDEGYHLAAVCTLRSYEILAEQDDPNRHLSGAYALSAGASVTMDRPNLWKAGFFNYLREDITFSLMNRRVLKIDLTNMTIPEEALDDEDQLNIAALYLAEAINLSFGQQESTNDAFVDLSARFQQWASSVPDRFTPFYDSSEEETASVFPTIRLLRDCHVAVAQYSLITTSLLCQIADDRDSMVDLDYSLKTNAVRLCGMAFTSNSSAVLVNSFGPISYYGRHIRDRALQADLVRRLHASGKETGWPVQRMIDDLEQHWSAESNRPDDTNAQPHYVHPLTAPD